MKNTLTLIPTETPELRLQKAIEEIMRTHGHRRPAVRASLELAWLMVQHPTMCNRDKAFAVAIAERSALVLKHAARGQPQMLNRQLKMAAETADFLEPLSL